MSMHNKLFILAILGGLIIVTLFIYNASNTPLALKDGIVKEYPSRLTALEIQAISPPLEGSYEEREEHLELAIKLARETASLDIKDCFGDPVVFKAKLGQEFTIKNLDSEDHIIAFNREHIFHIPALSEASIIAEFGFGSGVYGFSCDESLNATGMVLVEL